MYTDASIALAEQHRRDLLADAAGIRARRRVRSRRAGTGRSRVRRRRGGEPS
jgi:hypothetical protein